MNLIIYTFLPHNKGNTYSTMMSILSMSILTNLFISMKHSSHFIPLLLTITFSGGVMILFSITLSITPPTKNPKPLLNPLLIILILPITMENQKPMNLMNSNPSQHLYLNFSNHSLSIILMLTLTMMSIKSQMIMTNKPLKSSSQ